MSNYSSHSVKCMTVFTHPSGEDLVQNVILDFALKRDSTVTYEYVSLGEFTVTGFIPSLSALEQELSAITGVRCIRRWPDQ